MIKTILIGLDQSANTRHATTELGITWAKRFGAEVTGAVVIDRPWTFPMISTRVGAATYVRAQGDWDRIARTEANTFLDEFAVRCQVAGVQYRTQCETGDPVKALCAHHDDFDVTLLARGTRYRFLTPDEPDEVLTEVVRRSRRPVVAVPEVVPPGEEILVAYDGSSAAVDALESFAESGLGTDRRVTVVSANDDKREAARRADEAARYLAYHNVQAKVRPVTSGVREIDTLAALVQSASSGMVVMGAFAHGRMREWFHPCVTTRMLASHGRMLYLQHHPD